MNPDQKPSPRRMERAAIVVVLAILVIVVTLFIGRNIWHGQELEEEQRTGQNVVTQNMGE